MNNDNEWDQIADADIVEGPIERLTREEIMEAFKQFNIRRPNGQTEVYS